MAILVKRSSYDLSVGEISLEGRRAVAQHDSTLTPPQTLSTIQQWLADQGLQTCSLECVVSSDS